MVLDDRIVGVARTLETGVDIGEIAARDVEEVQGFLRRPKVDHAPCGHEDHVIADGDVCRCVGHQDDRTPTVGESAQGVHHLLLKAGVETARRLIKEEEAWVGEQFSTDTDPLTLATREALNQFVAMGAHLHIVENAADPVVDLAFRRIGGEA